MEADHIGRGLWGWGVNIIPISKNWRDSLSHDLVVGVKCFPG